MRLLYLAECLKNSEHQKRILNQAEKLVKKGHQVIIVGDLDKIEVNKNPEIKMMSFDFAKKTLPQSAGFIKNLVSCENIDLVVLCSFFSFLPGYCALMEKRVPYIVKLNSALDFSSWNYYDWKKDFLKDYLFEDASRIIVPSLEVKNFFMDSFSLGGDKVDILPPFLLDDKYGFIKNSEHKRLLVFCRLDESKKAVIKEAIRFYVYLRKLSGEDFSFTLIGTGELDEYFKEKIKKLNYLLGGQKVSLSATFSGKLNPSDIVVGQSKSVLSGIMAKAKVAVICSDGLRALCLHNYEEFLSTNFFGRNIEKQELGELSESLLCLSFQEKEEMFSRSARFFSEKRLFENLNEVYIRSVALGKVPSLGKSLDLFLESASQNVALSNNLEKMNDTNHSLDIINKSLLRESNLLQGEREKLIFDYEEVLHQKNIEIAELQNEREVLGSYFCGAFGALEKKNTFKVFIKERIGSLLSFFDVRNILGLHHACVQGENVDDNKLRNVCFDSLLRHKITYKDYRHKSRMDCVRVAVYISQKSGEGIEEVLEKLEKLMGERFEDKKIRLSFLVDDDWSESWGLLENIEDTKVYYLNSFLEKGVKNVFILNFVADRKIDYFFLSKQGYFEEGLMYDLSDNFDHLRVFQYFRMEKDYFEIDEHNNRDLLKNDSNNLKEPVLFIVPWFELGGAEKVLLNTIKNLGPDFFPVIITTLQSSNSWHYKFLKETPHVFHLPDILKKEQISREDGFEFISNLIQEYKVKIVHISNSTLGYSISPLLKHRFPSLKILDVIHTHDEEWDYLQYSSQYKEHLDQRVVVSAFLKDLLIKRYNEEEEKINVIDVGVDQKEFNQTNIKGGKDLYGLRDKFVCTFIGRLSKEKRPDFFVDIAYEFLRNNDEKAVFLIAGDGPMSGKIIDKVKSIGAGDNIRFLGARDDIPAILSVSDVCVMPSKYEGCPVTAIEAMSLGVPVVGSDVRGLKQMIIQGENGFLCKMDDTVDFCKKIRYFIDNPQKVWEMGEKGKKFVKEKYSIDFSAGKYRKMYLYLLDKYAEN